jgi:hypothetical protein
MPKAGTFPPDVVPKLKTYVYRLIDPRNGETFYIGKGQSNRVFAHIHDELSQDGDDLSDTQAHPRNRCRRLRGRPRHPPAWNG